MIIKIRALEHNWVEDKCTWNIILATLKFDESEVLERFKTRWIINFSIRRTKNSWIPGSEGSQGRKAINLTSDYPPFSSTSPLLRYDAITSCCCLALFRKIRYYPFQLGWQGNMPPTTWPIPNKSYFFFSYSDHDRYRVPTRNALLYFCFGAAWCKILRLLRVELLFI